MPDRSKYYERESADICPMCGGTAFEEIQKSDHSSWECWECGFSTLGDIWD